MRIYTATIACQVREDCIMPLWDETKEVCRNLRPIKFGLWFPIAIQMKDQIYDPMSRVIKNNIYDERHKKSD